MSEAGRLLAVIPARGGSKRLPRKNVLPLGGRPLIAWSIDAALASGVFDDVLVSTDDAEIADVARAAGAMVPWLRPAELASDTASSAAVLHHALRRYEAAHGAVRAVTLLQPTSPFRRAQSISAAVAAFLAQDPAREPAAVVSVSPVQHQHPAWCFRLDGEAMEPFLGWEQLHRRSQDLPAAFALNGAIYVFPAAQLDAADAPLLRPGVRHFVMADPRETLDIDTPQDWEAAQALAAQWTPPPP